MRCSAGIGMALVALVAPVDAQRTLTISSTPACPGCRAEIRRVLTVGGGSDSIVMKTGPIATVARDSKGRYYVTMKRPGIAVYDARGKFVRTLGRIGQGP